MTWNNDVTNIFSRIDKRKELWEVCEKYINDHRIDCPEDICQSDDVILDAYDFIGDICEIVGYYEYPEE